GEHLGIYHVGTTEEITVADLARRIARAAGREIALEPSATLAGSTARRCPDISKLVKLGYVPRVPLDAGLPPVLEWYRAPERTAPAGYGGEDLAPNKRRASRWHRSERPGRMLPGLRPRTADERAVARLHAAGKPDGADRRGAAPAAVVPDQSLALRQVR